MNQCEFTTVGYRATYDEAALADRKAKVAGLSRSEFLRRLVELAEVEPPKIGFVGNGNSRNAQNLVGSGVTAVR